MNNMITKMLYRATFNGRTCEFFLDREKNPVFFSGDQTVFAYLSESTIKEICPLM